MSEVASTRRIMEKALQDNMPGTLCRFQNTPQFVAPKNKNWLEFTAGDVDRTQVAIPDCVRLAGLAVVLVNTPMGSGTREAEELCDQVITIYDLKTLDGEVTCLACDRIEVGQVDDWYQFHVLIPFYRTES